MKIPFQQINHENQQFQQSYLQTLKKVMTEGHFVLGDSVKQLESQLAERLNCPYVISLNSGTDALFLSLKSLGISAGDEVITAPNSFIATAGAIAACGATPVFVDVAWDLNLDIDQIESAITPRTKAIIPVHLTGNPIDFEKLIAIAEKHRLKIVEDAAQAFGARWNQQMVGSIGNLGAFSLHPFKVLGGLGDGGFISTHSQQHYESLLALRNHGIHNGQVSQWGYNSRLDTLQAAFILDKLPAFDQSIQKRRAIAEQFNQRLSAYVDTPTAHAQAYSVYQTYIIKTPQRDKLMAFLKNQGIQTAVHYPVPLHLQPVGLKLGYQPGSFPTTEKLCRQILSLPISPLFDQETIDYISDNIIHFFQNHLS